MNKLLLTTAFCLIAGMAQAGGSYEQHGQPPATVTGQQSQGQLQGQLQGQRQGQTAQGGNAAALGGAGGSATARGGRGGAGGSGGNTGPVTVNNTTGGGGYNGPRYTTPDAIAPSIGTANECALPKSAGLSLFGFGASGGFANESDSCKRQRLATMLVRMGDPKGSREVLCLEDDMRRAAYSSGRPCARDARGWDAR